MKPTLLILAAGMGSRYGGLKQVDGVGPHGEAIIEYSIYDAIRAGFGKVVFVIRKDIEQVFKEKFANKFESRIEVAYAFQEYDSPIEGIDSFPERLKPWGTGHAMLVAKDVINEPFAVINADDYYGVSSFKDMADYLSTQSSPEEQSMIGYVLRNTLSDHGTVNRGVCVMDGDSYLQEVHERLKISVDDEKITYLGEDNERHPLQPSDLVSMNFWGFHLSMFEAFRTRFVKFVSENEGDPKAEFFIPLPIDHMIKEGETKVRVIPNDGQWYGVTYREDKEMVVKAFAEMTEQGIYPAPLWK